MAYVREYPSKIWPYKVQHLHFRILKFPLIGGSSPPNQATGHPHCDPDDIDGSDLADGGEPGDHYYGGMLWRAKNQRHGAK